MKCKATRRNLQSKNHDLRKRCRWSLSTVATFTLGDRKSSVSLVELQSVSDKSFCRCILSSLSSPFACVTLPRAGVRLWCTYIFSLSLRLCPFAGAPIQSLSLSFLVLFRLKSCIVSSVDEGLVPCVSVTLSLSLRQRKVKCIEAFFVKRKAVYGPCVFQCEG